MDTNNHMLEFVFDYPRTTKKDRYKEIHRWLRVWRNITEKDTAPKAEKAMKDLLLYGKAEINGH